MNKQLQKIVETRSVPIPECGCWLWTASSAKSGYGDFRLGRHYLAHRASYEGFVGPIPQGMHVLHKCDVRLCVNPSHLFVGTNKENIDDSVKKGRRKGVTRKRPSGLTYKPQSKETRQRRWRIPIEARENIKLVRNGGATLSETAEAFGVSKAAVSRIANGKYD